jgi:hypothetical protein
MTATAHIKTQVPVHSIRIEQAEGIDPMVKITVVTWAEAAAVLGKIALEAPKGGGYLKVDCAVEWADGFTVKVREDVKPLSATYRADLAGHIRELWQFYAGFRRPDHFTEEQYDAKITSDRERVAEATQALVRYSFTDAPASGGVDSTAKAGGASTAPAPVGSHPTPAEINRAKVLIASLVSRTEANNGKRALALELRKALAAMIRAEENHPT